MHFAEDANSAERLKVNAPYYFKHYALKPNESKQVNPLTTIYAGYEALPESIRTKISADWLGYDSFYFNDVTVDEIAIYSVKTQDGTVMYAIEKVAQIEVSNLDMLMLMGLIVSVGLMTIIIVTYLSIRMTNRLSQPFIDIAEQLTHGHDVDDLSPVTTAKETSFESELILDSINQYRKRIKNLIKREQNFSRYISHELRTPMTVIKGSLSVLRKKVRTNQPFDMAAQTTRIDDAVLDMEKLTQAILTLSREQEYQQLVTIDQELLATLTDKCQMLADKNKVTLSMSLSQTFTLPVEANLLAVLTQNLLNNAINCSIDGEVKLVINTKGLSVIDNGVGLSAKPRGYEGFGIGLNIVRDICQRYGWQFDLRDNEGAGCTAKVSFKP